MMAHIFISGSVQGVGFRQFTRWISRKLGVAGWVKNLPDGRVEAVLQGEKSQIDQVIVALRKGPPIAQVKDVMVTWEETEGEFEGFEIRH